MFYFLYFFGEVDNRRHGSSPKQVARCLAHHQAGGTCRSHETMAHPEEG